MPRRRRAAGLARTPWLAAAAAAAAAGCGSLPPTELPPAATPAVSPPPAAAPAGRVVPAGSAPAAERLVSRPAGRLTVGSRTVELLERAHAVRVLEDGREVARARTGLQPAALTLLEEDRLVAVLSVRERVLELFDARTLARIGRAAAGTGPAGVVSNGGNYLYVTDTTAGAVLVFRRAAGELRLDRRYRLAGAPYAIDYDRVNRRLWVTLTASNELVELSAGRRPRELRRFPAVRQPNAVAVTPGGRVVVAAATGNLLQLLDPPSPRRGG